MDIYKIIAIALITASLCVYLKSINSEFFIVTLICGGVLLVSASLNYLVTAFDLFRELFEKTQLSSELFSLIIKVTLVAYLIEFSCSMIEDFGVKSLADKVGFAGKILLICMSIPIFNRLFEIIVELLT